MAVKRGTGRRRGPASAVALNGIRGALAKSLRTRVLLLTLLAFAVVSVPAYFSFVAIVNATVVKLGTLFAEKQILFDRYRGMGALMQEVKLAETLARSGAIEAWARQEDNPVLKARGIAELEHFREAFSDHSYFFVVGASGNYYFNDSQNSYAGRQLSHTLSRNNPRDAWYYKTAALGAGCHLNVDHDDALGVTKVWINCVIRDGDTVLGVLGSGLDLTSFVREVVDIPQTGVTAMFVDRSGAVQAHRDPRLVDFHSLTKDVSNKKTVFSLLDRPEDRETMQAMMDRVTSSDVQVESHFMRINGAEVLVGVGYLDRLGWYNITVMDVDQIIDRGLFLPIGLLLGAIMLLSVIAVGFVFKRQVLDRLARVEGRFAAVHGGRISPGVVDAGTDEIGRMSRAFEAMAAQVSGNTARLEKAVSERTAELKALAYRDQLTGIANRRGFIEAFERIREDAGKNARLGLMLIDIDAFKTVNDTIGHQAGDELVAEVARRLTGMSRAADACGRWGGDEFILLVSDIEPGELKLLADAVRLALSTRPVKLGEREVTITVSVGASEIAEGDTLEAAVDLADAALYRAKSEGRDRAVAFDPAWGLKQSA
jgi:diguanylate cyclase (GGDEF)-like protein